MATTTARQPSGSAALVSALAALRQLVAVAPLALETPTAETARRSKNEITGQVDDYLLPRLLRLDAPLLTVVGGSTGAGKSTLVNSLIGEQVTSSGVLRPTTRAPVLICNPADLASFSDDRVLPGLARTTGGPAGPGSLQLVERPTVPVGLALLDAPDIDSVVAANRELAASLLAAADLWLFVTTAARYADAVPWDLLHTAQERSTALAVVLDRVPPEAMAEVEGDLETMLKANGLERAALFSIPETPLVDGLLPPATVAPVRRWLDGLAADAEARSSVVRTTLNGALDSLSSRVPALAEAVDAQEVTAQRLRTEARRAYAAARTEVEDGVKGGSLLRGEVLARWQDFIGTGEFMRGLEARVGWLRDRLRSVFTGAPPPGAELASALETSVESLVRAAADRAAERSVDSWRGSPAGGALLARGDRDLARASRELPAATADEVRSWQAYVLALVADEGAAKRTTARAASLGVNATGLAVMVGVFAHTGGLTGAEIAVASGTSAVNQKLLEAVFGDQAVRSLAGRARVDLMERVDRLLDAEAERFDRLLDPATPAPGSADGLRSALSALQDARRRSPLVPPP